MRHEVRGRFRRQLALFVKTGVIQRTERYEIKNVHTIRFTFSALSIPNQLLAVLLSLVLCRARE